MRGWFRRIKSFVICFAVLCIAASISFSDVDLDLLGSSGLVYDDNVTYNTRNKIGELSNNTMAGLRVSSEQRTSLLDLQGTLTQQTFFNRSDFNNLSTELSADFFKEWGPHSEISATDELNQSEVPKSFDDDFGGAQGRYSYIRNVLGLSMKHDFSKYTRAKLMYRNDYYDPSRDDLSTSTKNLIGGTLEYQFTPSFSLLTFYDYTYRYYERLSLGSTENHTGFGLRKYFTRQLYLEGKGGASFIKDYSGGEFTKPRYSVSLVNEVDRRTVRGISYERHYNTNASNADIFDSWKISGNYSRQLSQRLNGRLTAFIGRGEYLTSQISNDLFGISTGMTYELTENWKADLGYSYQQSESSAAGKFTRNLFNIGLQFVF